MYEFRSDLVTQITSDTSFNEQLKRLDELPRFKYDWSKNLSNSRSIEEEIRKSPDGKLSFVGYGSLLNTGSASRTLSKEIIRSRKPIIVFGAKRVFNYSMGSAVSNYGLPENPKETAALNIHLTGSLHDYFNGILIKLPIDEIAALRKRELDYDLEPVVYTDWEIVKGDKRPVDVAYALTCHEKLEGSTSRVDRSLYPHRKYFDVCKKGAGEFGSIFLKQWLDTTFLADGTTTVKNWQITQSGSPGGL